MRVAAASIPFAFVGLGGVARSPPWQASNFRRAKVTSDGAVVTACAGAPRDATVKKTLPRVAGRLHAPRRTPADKPFAEAFDLAASPWASFAAVALRDMLPMRAAKLVVVDLHAKAELAPGNAKRTRLKRAPPAAHRTAVAWAQGPPSGHPRQVAWGPSCPAFGGHHLFRGAFRMRSVPWPPWLRLGFSGGRPHFSHALQRRSHVTAAGALRKLNSRHQLPFILKHTVGLLHRQGAASGIRFMESGGNFVALPHRQPGYGEK